MLILRLSKREDQALIPISTILKFSAQNTLNSFKMTLRLHAKCGMKLKIVQPNVLGTPYQQGQSGDGS